MNATGDSCGASRSKPITEMLACFNGLCGDDIRWRSRVCRPRYLALHLREHNVLGSAGVSRARRSHMLPRLPLACYHLMDVLTCLITVAVFPLSRFSTMDRSPNDRDWLGCLRSMGTTTNAHSSSLNWGHVLCWARHVICTYTFMARMHAGKNGACRKPRPSPLILQSLVI